MVGVKFEWFGPFGNCVLEFPEDRPVATYLTFIEDNPLGSWSLYNCRGSSVKNVFDVESTEVALLVWDAIQGARTIKFSIHTLYNYVPQSVHQRYKKPLRPTFDRVYGLLKQHAQSTCGGKIILTTNGAHTLAFDAPYGRYGGSNYRQAVQFRTGPLAECIVKFPDNPYSDPTELLKYLETVNWKFELDAWLINKKEQLVAAEALT